jgi:hypothetical protein
VSSSSCEPSAFLEFLQQEADEPAQKEARDRDAEPDEEDAGTAPKNPPRLLEDTGWKSERQPRGSPHDALDPPHRWPPKARPTPEWCIPCIRGVSIRFKLYRAPQ